MKKHTHHTKSFLDQLKHETFLISISLIAVGVIGVYFVYQKILYYSADPNGEKDCTPLQPSTWSGPTALTTLLSTSLPWSQKGGTINDASCVNKTPVYGIVQVHTEDDIRTALRFATENKLKVTVAGVRHSMGGHAFLTGGVVLDMKKFNAISLDPTRKTVTVQAGATWHDIQNKIHPDFAIKAMQSTDIFTVGGSISVNAHGMDHQVGSIARTIKSMRVMVPDGKIQTLSATQNPRLFRHVIGGYGLFGVILDVELEVTDNVVYQTERRIIDYKDFVSLFNNEIVPHKEYGLMYGHLSTAPDSFLKEMILYTYKEVDDPHAQIGPLTDVGSVKLRRFVVNLSKQGTIQKRIKWFAEKYIEPKLETCTVVSRNQAIKEGEACLVSRNDPMHDSVPYLRNSLKQETDILHEYFIPRAQFIPYIDRMREILTRNHTNLLNASVRVVHKEDIALNYAPEDMFSIVLYINQKTDTEGHRAMKAVTQELIDLTLQVGGRFFLPYQLYYSPEQLKQAYPEIQAVFAEKKRVDPSELLTNTFYNTYAPTLNQ